jgi:hypothetical protein
MSRRYWRALDRFEAWADRVLLSPAALIGAGCSVWAAIWFGWLP